MNPLNPFTISPAALDRLTSRLTAFDTFTEFATAMWPDPKGRQVYRPTIYPTTTERMLLISILRIRGFDVFHGAAA